MIFPTAVKAAHAGGGVRKSPRLSHDSPERYRQQRWSDTAAAPQTAAATLRFKNACKNSKNVATVAVTEHSASRASMVNFLGMQTEASSRDSWSRCLTRRGGCGAFGTGWGWRWSRTAARWSCTASHTWTRTCRCWRWGGGRGRWQGRGLQAGEGEAGRRGDWCPLGDAVCCVVIKSVLRRIQDSVRVQGGVPALTVV